MRSYNQCPVISPITVLSLLLWSLNRVAMRLLFSFDQIFCAVLHSFEPAHLLLARSTIALAIISLQALKGISNVEKSSESSMVISFLANSFDLQLPEKFLCQGTQMIQTSYRLATSLRHLRQSCTVLEFITLESNAFRDAWISESMEIFRL